MGFTHTDAIPTEAQSQAAGHNEWGDGVPQVPVEVGGVARRYLPDANGKEPLGTFNKGMREFKLARNAIKWATKSFGFSVKLFSYTNFYDQKTFKKVLLPIR